MTVKYHADHYSLRVRIVEVEEETPTFYILKGGSVVNKFEDYFGAWVEARAALEIEARNRVEKAEYELVRLRARLAETESLTPPEGEGK